ncbi:HNH endonuclease [Pseudomonas benzopyrenica]|uniref:HNH endonuclease n=1 Tax=Pseudomonas benzopyrenica TaxID=2993566 RepID=UPI003F177ED0
MRKAKACSVCGGKNRARGLCIKHYNAAKSAGELDSHSMERAPAGSGTINADGYRVIYRPGHPKARANGKVLEHVAKFHDAYGDGPFDCHVCGQQIAPEDFSVDHLNEVKADNDLANLAPAHLACNNRRSTAKRRIRFGGELMTAGQIADALNLTRDVVEKRAATGKPLEEITSRKIRKGRTVIGHYCADPELPAPLPLYRDKAKRAAYLIRNAEQFAGFDWSAYHARQALLLEGDHHV